jgi:Tol biopolymer transport system component
MSVEPRRMIVIALAGVALSAGCGQFVDTSPPGTFDGCPSWSPDGSRVAFIRAIPETGSSPRQPSGQGRLLLASPDGFRLIQAASVSARAEILGWTEDGAIVIRPPGGRSQLLTLGAARLARRTPAPRGTVIVRNGERYRLDASGKAVRVWRRRPPAALTRIQPVWSPDRRRIAFTASQTGPDSRYQIYVTRADGSGRRQLTNNEENVQLGPPAWSPDGTQLLYEGAGLWTVSLQGESKNLTGGFAEGMWCETWSPAGEWIAFLRAWPGGILLAGESIVMVIRPDGSDWKRLDA